MSSSNTYTYIHVYNMYTIYLIYTLNTQLLCPFNRFCDIIFGALRFILVKSQFGIIVEIKVAVRTYSAFPPFFHENGVVEFTTKKSRPFSSTSSTEVFAFTVWFLI